MKNKYSILAAMFILTALLAAGCGGGHGAVSVIEARDGEKLCVPKGAGRTGSALISSREEYQTMHGAVTFMSGPTQGDILISFTDTADPDYILALLRGASQSAYNSVLSVMDMNDFTATQTTEVDYYAAFGTALRSADCGEMLWFSYGTVGSTGALTDNGTVGFDDCGSYAGMFLGSKSGTSASGRFSIAYYDKVPLDYLNNAAQNSSPTNAYAASWGAAELNCARVGRNGETAQNEESVAAGSQLDFDAIIFNLNCLITEPVKYNDYPLVVWSAGIDYNSTTGAYTRSQSSSAGSINNDGVYTASSSPGATGSVWVEYGGLFDRITVNVTQ